MNANRRGHRPSPPNPLSIVGAILAQGVIRRHDLQDRLAMLTEERVSTGVSTPKEIARD